MSGTPEQHAAAVATTLTSALAPKLAYDFDEVPETRPLDYTEYSVTRRFGGEFKQDGFVGTTSWRVMTRYVSKSSISNARLMQDKTRQALEFVALTVNGEQTTRLQFETSEPIGSDDDGYFTGLDSWIYVL